MKVLEKNSINFFESSGVKTSSRRHLSGTDRGLIILVAGVAGVMLIAVGTLFLANFMTQRQINSMKEYLNDPQNTAQNQEIISKDATIQGLKKYRTGVTNLVGFLETYPETNAALLTKISSAMPAGVAITKLSTTRDSITLTCTAAAKEQPGLFAAALEQTESFYAVSYGGYNMDDGKITFQISVLLKGGNEE